MGVVLLGKLYIVATPIGNLEDVTLRALRIFSEVGLILAEDTRMTRKLLSHFSIKTRMLSYNQHNASRRVPGIFAVLAVQDIALVSDAGVPTISDPGSDLIKKVLDEGFSVVPIPGASAVTAALSMSGISADRFVFMGFLPRIARKKKEALSRATKLGESLVIFESPRRLQATLRDMIEVLGDCEVVVCREMTKIHEEIYRGYISGAMSRFSLPRGEFVLLVKGQDFHDQPPSESPKLIDILNILKTSGDTSARTASNVAKMFGVNRRDTYHLWDELCNSTPNGP